MECDPDAKFEYPQNRSSLSPLSWSLVLTIYSTCHQIVHVFSPACPTLFLSLFPAPPSHPDLLPLCTPVRMLLVSSIFPFTHLYYPLSWPDVRTFDPLTLIPSSPFSSYYSSVPLPLLSFIPSLLPFPILHTLSLFIFPPSIPFPFLNWKYNLGKSLFSPFFSTFLRNKRVAYIRISNSFTYLDSTHWIANPMQTKIAYW